MKREGYEHAKFKLVSRDLDMGLGAVRGYVDSIWHETAMHFPAGDIGRYSNEEIAIAIDYRGDADELIQVLIKRRLLDELPEEQGRLYVHDWHDHCDEYTRQKLRNRKMTFANGAPPYAPKEATGTEANRKKQKSTENHRDEQKVTAPDQDPDLDPKQDHNPLPPAGEVGGDRQEPKAEPVVPPVGYQAKRTPLRQQAADLWLAGGSRALFNWCGDVAGEPYQRWLDAVEKWLEAGLIVDLAFLESVTAETWKRYQAKGSQGAKTLQWWLNTANDLAIKPPTPKPAPRIMLPQPPIGPSEEEQRARRRAYYERLAALPPNHPDVVEAEQSEVKRVAIARTRERLSGRLRGAVAASGVGELAGAA